MASEPLVSESVPVVCASLPVAVGDAEVSAGVMLPAVMVTGIYDIPLLTTKLSVPGLPYPPAPIVRVQVALVVPSGVHSMVIVLQSVSTKKGNQISQYDTRHRYSRVFLRIIPPRKSIPSLDGRDIIVETKGAMLDVYWTVAVERICCRRGVLFVAIRL